jgi:hypothetical protein
VFAETEDEGHETSLLLVRNRARVYIPPIAMRLRWMGHPNLEGSKTEKPEA